MILVGSLRVALVRGPSMVPTLRDGDRVLVRMGPLRRTPVGRVVLVELPDRPLSVKRLVALEADGSVRVEGDNEFGSTDSRTLGPQPAGAVRGVVLARLWPSPRILR
ncbi:MAG TPA: S24/S26 family peptidase [Mycobacteriales bacterium]|nr:S24/S26 family peptidase [Mycobacteriales bacterium]